MLTEAVWTMTDPLLLNWNNHSNPTHMHIQSAITLNDFIFLHNIRWRNNGFTYTHAGLMRQRTDGGSGGPIWGIWRRRPRSHSPSLCCHNCCGASGCGPSSWSLLSNHLYTSVSSTSLWSPPHNAISVNNNQSRNKQGDINQKFFQVFSLLTCNYV